jgi:hypothetical protein
MSQDRNVIGQNVTATKDVAVGRNMSVQGEALFAHGVRIEGVLDAPNIRSAFKGLYADLSALQDAYPNPAAGWFALVGDSLPAEVYRAQGGQWVDTGSQGGEFKVDFTYRDEDIDNISAQLQQLMEALSGGSTLDESDYFKNFLRRDRVEQTSYLMRLLGGAEFGKFIKSMTAGSGAGIDAQGNAQVESLEVRGYAKIMELIINRLTAMEGDYTFTECGTIETITQTTDGAYVLTMRKRWDYDFTAFKDNDVLYGTVNTLAVDGSYYTSWCRVVGVNQTANTITVVLYSDKEVPAGKNFPPTVGMNLARRGNALDTSRQSCWYISSSEGVIMYLEGVTKPILEESNYYLSLGKPKHLSLFNGLQLDYNHPYLFARGVIIQDLWRVDYKGNPVYVIVDAGLWNATSQYVKGYDEAAQAYIQHQVWWADCCWRCLVAKATIGKEPRWNNTEWVCVVGDVNYTLTIESSAGNFLRYGREYTTLTATLRHGSKDITADAWQIAWTRESGLDEEDTIWAIAHQGAGMSVTLTPEDMPSNWYETRKVVFRCTITLLEGSSDDNNTISEVFSIS